MAIFVSLSVWHWQNNQMTTVPPSCSKHDVRFKIRFLQYYPNHGVERNKTKSFLSISTGYWEGGYTLRNISGQIEGCLAGEDTQMSGFCTLIHTFPVIVICRISSHVLLVGVSFCLSSLLWWKDVVFLNIWNICSLVLLMRGWGSLCKWVGRKVHVVVILCICLTT